jgi:GH24 family phage-related lysozyme (muramidase)
VSPEELVWSQAYTTCNEGGFRPVAYLDSLGNWTVGIGCKGPDPFCSPDPVIGSNTVWTSNQGSLEFNRRHATACAAAEADLGPTYWAALDGTRQAALVDTAYQEGGGNAATGLGGLAGYHLMLAAIRVEDWVGAGSQCIHSLADRQTPERVARNAMILQTGNRPELNF